ncbi:DNA-binding response regulator [Weizmannia acidilactici]|uniref:DNA-binding response regulator n=1 Tax=Weizmannia acidilactici TaxID=2607726 RepID=A0A5J4JGC8_9BACI|nr:response regulator transcription factor [Weizmannia acidilactici]GER66314.1 DNA-binding response regulator [Weizmannia acidilactici]GER69540.1 DNA-binding response regulator [Weizmannia acidilactici]GER74003.1 DNA-binding response regulator [Weizmannia acidilactici]
MKILLAEDDKRFGNLLCHMLEKEKHQVAWEQDGVRAYDEALFVPYDMLILDWMMPRLDGLEICRKLREQGFQGGIIMVTARDAVNDVVAGLRAGADDYIVKPFAFEELLARIYALQRREWKTYKETLSCGYLTLHLESKQAEAHGEMIPLTRKEYQLCEYLMRNKNLVVPREKIVEQIWGPEEDVSDNALDALVKLLRKKIDRKGDSSLIETVRGIGYRMNDGRHV